MSWVSHFSQLQCKDSKTEYFEPCQEHPAQHAGNSLAQSCQETKIAELDILGAMKTWQDIGGLRDSGVPYYLG